MDRRAFVTTAVGTLVAATARGQSSSTSPVRGIADPPSRWDVDRSVANLEHAYWGVMPRVVNDEYLAQTRFLNERNVLFVRDGVPGRERTRAMDDVRGAVAALMAAPKNEFALTRNGTEALQNLIMQYGRLRRGDRSQLLRPPCGTRESHTGI